MRLHSPAFSVVLALGIAGSAGAATNQAAGLQPDRWLLVVDVSSPMKNRASAVRNAVAQLLDSSMNGQLQEGHEIGLWTFNDELHTDLDVMKWMDFRTNAIKNRLLTHLDAQKYGRRPNFDETLENMKAVVADSRRLTLILMSDGDELFPGTPHEAAMAERFRTNREEARSSKVPIITVFRGSKGEWAGFTQSFPPWPMSFPDFPPEPVPEPAPANEVASGNTEAASPGPAPANRRSVIVAEPLVVRGPDPLSKEIEEKGLATNPASGNLIVQKPEPPLPLEPVSTNTPVAIEEPEVSEPAWPSPVTEPQATDPAPRKLGLWIIVALGGVALAILAVLVLRSRASGHRRTSVITRSMDRNDDKPRH